jgi:hypothetical protein
MRVDHVVPAAADLADEAGQRRQVPVAVHAEVHDAYAVRGEVLGDRARVGEGHHVAVDRQVADQEAQLLLGPAHAEAGDDVQGLHGVSFTGDSPDAGDGRDTEVGTGSGGVRGTGRRRSRLRRYFRSSRQEVSFSPMWTRGRANGPVSGPGSIAHP